ncbi:MAG: sigma-70 family RNA polymerase sigma factor [Lentisphaeria bacterium]
MEPVPDASEHDLIRRHLDGDTIAFERLYHRWRAPLYGYLNRLLPDQGATVDDLFQQTWLRVVDALPRYHEQQRFAAWLFGIAHNLLLDHHRHQAVSPLAPPGEVPLDDLPVTAGPEPWMAWSARELGDALAAALEQLPPDLREVFLLRRQGVSFKDIADLQKTGLNTVLGRMHYAVRRLRCWLEEWRP